MNPVEKLSRARGALILQAPFYGVLALSLKVTISDEFPTMATNGRDLFANPAFIDATGENELIGVVAHEVMHNALLHHTRREKRDAKLWNVAADYAINGELLKAGFKLPDGALVNSRFDGLGAEAIYRMLESEQQQTPQPQPGQGQGQGAPGPAGQGGTAPSNATGAPQNGAAPGSQPGQGSAGSDPGGCGEILDAAPEHDGAAMAAAEADMLAKVRQAIAVAKARGAGKVPGDLEALVATLDKPRLDPRAIFRRFIDDSTSKDYTWSRPNRRHIARGLILPSAVPDRPAHIVAMVDSSGSMSESDVSMLTAELQAALDEGAADRVTVAYADTRVGIHGTYEPGDVIALKGAPRGGTDFREPFKWVAEHCPDASAILYLTDMDSDHFGDEPAAPVLWIVTGDPREAQRHVARAPFGESILLGE
jgi:predicted metal-dependent peptidase